MGELKSDLRSILDGQLDGSAKNYKLKAKAQIILKHISSEYYPLGVRNISSVVIYSRKSS